MKTNTKCTKTNYFSARIMKYLLLRGALNKNSLVLDELAKKQQIRSNILKRKNSKLEATFLREKNSLNNLGSQFKF